MILKRKLHVVVQTKDLDILGERGGGFGRKINILPFSHFSLKTSSGILRCDESND